VTDHPGRLATLREAFGSLEIDALLITNLTNVRYLTGFSGTNGQVLVTTDRATFFSDPRYRARAAELVAGAEIAIYPNRLTELLPEHLGGAPRVGVEGATMTLAQHQQISESLTDAELVVTSDAVEDLRRVKDDAEIDLIRRAVSVADDAYSWVLERLRPGVRERDVALDLEIRMRTEGAEDVSFEPIVGSGPLSAHIHHTPGERVFEKGDLILMDFGARVDGYCSDMTRTVVLGAATDDQRAQYELVLAAQQRGVEAAVAGAACARVDDAARSVIADAGFGEAFAHGLGHGVGLDIHEAPRLGRISEDTLQSGEVVTIEPGVYLEEGGIRIEDCVLVNKDGARILTGAPKQELLEL
jgi:Xaa-Pro aminopeptidase